MTPEVLEELDLSQRPLGENLLAEDIGHFLDSNPFSVLGVCGCAACVSVACQFVVALDLPDDTICTLTQLFRNCVSLIDHKILIEDLEHFAPTHVGHGGSLDVKRELGYSRENAQALVVVFLMLERTDTGST